MNGRIFDPILGRFLSGDPYVNSIEDSQSYNRYSYCNNNPLNSTDPSGYFKLNFKTIAIIAAVVVVCVVTYGAASGYAMAGMTATEATAGASATYSIGGVAISAGTASTIAAAAGGAAAGAAGGFTSSLLNGGSVNDAFRAGAIGALVGGVSAGVGQYLSGLSGSNPYIARFAAGALRGEIETGNWEGALRGGAINMLPTDMWMGDAYRNSMTVNFAVNTARDAIQGYVINGEVGAERSVIGGWANDAVGHGLGLISSGGEAPTFKDGMYWYATHTATGYWLMNTCNYAAITFGNVVTTTQSVINAGYGYGHLPITYANAETVGTNRYDYSWTYAHEIDHYSTQGILGTYYIPLQAVSQGMGSTLSGRYAYLEQWPFKLLPYGGL